MLNIFGVLGFKNTIRLFGLVCFLAGIGIGIFNYAELGRIIAIHKNGVVTQALVTDKGAGGNPASYYFAQTRYMVGGKTYDHPFEVTEAEWQKLEKGSTLTVRYLPKDPSYAFLDADTPSIQRKILQPLGAILISLFVFIGAEYIPSAMDDKAPDIPSP